MTLAERPGCIKGQLPCGSQCQVASVHSSIIINKNLVQQQIHATMSLPLLFPVGYDLSIIAIAVVLAFLTGLILIALRHSVTQTGKSFFVSRISLPFLFPVLSLQSRHASLYPLMPCRHIQHQVFCIPPSLHALFVALVRTEKSANPSSPAPISEAHKPSNMTSTPTPTPTPMTAATTSTSTSTSTSTKASNAIQIPTRLPNNNQTPSPPSSSGPPLMSMSLNQAAAAAALPWRTSFSHLVRRRSSNVSSSSTGLMAAVSVSDTVLGRKGSACTARWSEDGGSCSEGVGGGSGSGSGAGSGSAVGRSTSDHAGGAGESMSMLAGVGGQFGGGCFGR
ncbi:hypothetical protein N658DRAFT_301600 [Parathielavia hyrcaniae]|uniref:Uncharacterized protein n=1 Tax=Parathielavia hyrcaniae TaxID=113614 RepID=A0AAN6Q3Z9_9PEZI|nr:hypothetical protein N658DRAFT_301600 [Parathielavia hyrcaniae]